MCMSLSFPGHTKRGEKMNLGQNYFSILLRRTIYGQEQIHALLRTPMKTQFRMLLLLQQKEYHSLEMQLRTVLSQRQIHVKECDPLLLLFSCKIRAFLIHFRKTDHDAISYMIKTSVQGFIDGLIVLRHCNIADSTMRLIAQKLLDCERAFIIRLQDFL